MDDAAKRVKTESGRYVDAGDRLETMRPGYAVVSMQQRQKRTAIAVKSARLGADGRSVIVETAPRVAAVNYSLALAGGPDLAHDLSGVAATCRGTDGAPWDGWLPHPDFVAAREFTRGSASHDTLWKDLAAPGKLTLRGQLDLWQMLIPATQPISKLDYTPEPETVTVVVKSGRRRWRWKSPARRSERVTDRESRFTVSGPVADRWPSFLLTVATPARWLEVSFHTSRDPAPRALQVRRFLVPFAVPGAPDDLTAASRRSPAAIGAAGHALFKGKAACATCHQLRGEGVKVGPDLSNSVHSDYASLLKNIVTQTRRSTRTRSATW